MPRRAGWLQIVLVLAACGPTPEDATEAIRQMLTASAAAWNAGDLDGFMRSYAPGADVTFVGYRELLYGHEAVRRNYAPLFEPGAQRDSLRFEDMQIRLVAPKHAVGYARWVLSRNGNERSGPFTIVLERRGRDWVIVHDHSSED